MELLRKERAMQWTFNLDPHVGFDRYKLMLALSHGYWQTDAQILASVLVINRHHNFFLNLEL
jgi:hypothetical protein